MKMRSAAAVKPKYRRWAGTALAAAATGALTLLAVSGGASASDTAGARAAAPATDETPGPVVENFNYPNAAKVLAEKNIVLKRGDGHITLADCVSGTGQLEIYPRSKDKVCFQVTGNSGWLTMEIPSVYGVKNSDTATQLDMTTGTETKSFDVAKNAWAPVGESADPQGRDYMLVEIKTSK
ncbi:hypothetical protein ACFYOD_35600 [Streptomyces sp. NPDC006703]|uniref:hypothetical protein n=1 Tax=Streptomyces sp. NPDC006703 TaxID=3364759 RepID=UPI0036B71655